MNYIEKIFKTFHDSFLINETKVNILISQSILILYFLWKFNSRDFSFYAYTHEISLYPSQIYPAGYFLFAPDVLQDIFSFHFIHIFIPKPNKEAFLVLYVITNLLLFFHLIFGFRYKVSAFLLYIILIYQWSFIFFKGQEVDSMMIYFGCLLIYCFFCPKINWFNYTVRELNEKNLKLSELKSYLILVFVIYYVASGINKLTDITIIEWFFTDLATSMKKMGILSKYTTYNIFDFFKFFYENKTLSFFINLSVPIVYISHLYVFKIFYQRNLIIFFHLFYAIFHLMTFSVGISFTGYIFVWFLIYPYSQYFSQLKKLTMFNKE